VRTLIAKRLLKGGLALLVVPAVLVVSIGLSGFGTETELAPGVAGVPGVPAVWVIDVERQDAHPDDRSFTAFVGAAMECQAAGQPLPPDVNYEAERIVVTFTATDMGQRCGPRESRPYEVHLDERIGDRQLVDGWCVGAPAGEAACRDGGIRWPR
jgi:hypothetical protein